MSTNDFLSNLAIVGLRVGSHGHRDYRLPLTAIVVLAMLYKHQRVTNADVATTIDRITDDLGTTVSIHGHNVLSTDNVKNLLNHIRNNVYYIHTVRENRSVVYYISNVGDFHNRLAWFLGTPIGSKGDPVWDAFEKIVDCV